MNAQSQFGDLQHQKIFLLFSRHAFHATQPSLEMILELEVDGAAAKAGPTEPSTVSLYPPSNNATARCMLSTGTHRFLVATQVPHAISL